MTTDYSRIPKFNTGTLVVYGRKVYIVDHNSGPDTCHLKMDGDIIEVPERFVRGLTRMEYAWYRDPQTGGMKVGRTPAKEWIIQALASLLLIAGAWLFIDSWGGWLGIGRGVALFIGSARIAIMVYGFFRNYKGLQA